LPDIEELNEDTVTSMRQFLTYSREAGTILQQGGMYSPTARSQVLTYSRKAGTLLRQRDRYSTKSRKKSTRPQQEGRYSPTAERQSTSGRRYSSVAGRLVLPSPGEACVTRIKEGRQASSHLPTVGRQVLYSSWRQQAIYHQQQGGRDSQIDRETSPEGMQVFISSRKTCR